MNWVDFLLLERKRGDLSRISVFFVVQKKGRGLNGNRVGLLEKRLNVFFLTLLTLVIY